jgi:hypothetical protein
VYPPRRIQDAELLRATPALGDTVLKMEIDSDRGQYEPIAKRLGVTVSDLSIQLVARGKRLVGLVRPQTDLTPTEMMVERMWAEPLAYYAFENDLSDEEVADQARSESGPAWDYASQQRDEGTAALQRSMKPFIDSVQQQLNSPLVRSLRKGNLTTEGLFGKIPAPTLFSKMIGQRSGLGDFSSLADTIGRAGAASAALEAIGKSIAEPRYPPIAQPLVDPHAARAREREEQERAWRDNTLKIFVDLSSGMENIYASSENASKSARRIGIWGLIGIALTLAATILVGLLG